MWDSGCNGFDGSSNPHLSRCDGKTWGIPIEKGIAKIIQLMREEDFKLSVSSSPVEDRGRRKRSNGLILRLEVRIGGGVGIAQRRLAISQSAPRPKRFLPSEGPAAFVEQREEQEDGVEFGGGERQPGVLAAWWATAIPRDQKTRGMCKSMSRCLKQW